MKKWLGMIGFAAALTAFSWQQPAQAFQIQDCISVKSDPIGAWKKMRPQDFVGAPTLWQIIV